MSDDLYTIVARRFDKLNVQIKEKYQNIYNNKPSF